MKEINSTHNDVYKLLKQLATSAKVRRRNSQTLLEGVHLCQSFLQTGKAPLLLVCTRTAAENPEVEIIIAACEKLQVQTVLLSENNFKAISSVDNGIGVMMMAMVPVVEPPACIRENALLLEDVQDPGNAGAILRTAAASGVTEIYTSAGSASLWSPKALRAGMGAHFVLRMYENCDLPTLISNAKVPVLATSLRADETIYEKDLSTPAAWLFGNEGQGVSERLLALDVQKVIIPQNPKVESLNVAASVAICLFEQARQMSASSQELKPV